MFSRKRMYKRAANNPKSIEIKDLRQQELFQDDLFAVNMDAFSFPTWGHDASLSFSYFYRSDSNFFRFYVSHCALN